MIALAEHDVPGASSLLSARRIAEQMRIPTPFAAHVLGDLMRAGMVTGRAGRTGGYRLARPAGAISLLQVVDAADGGSQVTRCVLRGSPCDPNGRCAVHDTIARTTSAARAELARTSLADLVGTRGL
jgi:Rrf2 family protein